MGRSMDPRRLTGPDPQNDRPDRRFGRRASDGASQMRFHAAAFVAQVAGLSLPGKGGAGAYRAEAVAPPTGLVANLKA